MKATTTLPNGYAQWTIFDPAVNRKLLAAVVLTGVILLVGNGRYALPQMLPVRLLNGDNRGGRIWWPANLCCS
jgi:hypothetical protein